MMKLALTSAAALLFVAACGKDTNNPDMPKPPDLSMDSGLPPDMTFVPPTFAVPGGCATATVNLSAFYTNIISNNCAQANCHRSGGPTPTMGPADMAGFRTNIIGVGAAGRQPASLKYVATINATTGDLDNSFLVYKITGQQGKVQFGGAQMPNNLPALTPTEQCQIINWVRSGAN